MKRFLLIVFLFLGLKTVQGQIPKPFSATHIWSYPRDGWGLLKAPVDWDRKDWGIMLAGTALVYGAYSLDEDLWSRIKARPDNGFSTGWLAGSRHWGDGLYSLPVFAGIYFYGRYNDNPKQQLAAMNATKAFILSRLIVQMPKFLFQRHSPGLGINGGSGNFDGPLGGGVNRSFPSGHTISAFAAAEVFRLSFDDWWVGGLAYLAATSVAAHRVATGAHWLSDVTTSALLGAAMGHWIQLKGTTRWNLYSSHLPSSSSATLGVVCRF